MLNTSKHINNATKQGWNCKLFFGDKFNIKTADQSKDRIREALEGRVENKDLISQTEKILSQCEMARFAPTSDVDREKVYQDSVTILSEIQKRLKWKDF